LEARTTPTLGDIAAKGVVWLVAQTVISRGAQLIAQVLLTWFLAPEDFGKISLAYTVTTLVSASFGLGIEDVLLQRLKTLRFWVRPAFRLSLGASIIGALIALAAAPLAASVYQLPDLIELIGVIALAMPISALGTVPSVVLRASLKFPLLAIVSLFETLSTLFLTIVLAAFHFGAFSFVLPLPIVAALKCGILWYFARPHFARQHKRRQWLPLIKNSTAILGTNLLTAAVGQGDYIALGLVASDAVVGIYFFAFKIAIQPLRMLAGGLSSVLFPTLAQLTGDPARQRDAAILAARMLSIVVMPACFLQAALAGPVLQIFFSARWAEAEPLLQILSVGLAFDAVSWAAGALLHARGQFGLSLTYSIIFTPAFFLFVGIGAIYGSSTGVALGVTAFYMSFPPIFSYFVFCGAGASASEVVSIYAAPIFFGSTIVGLAYVLAQFFDGAPLAQILFIMIFSSISYLCVIRIFCRIPYLKLTERLRGVFLRKRDRLA
jgi:teichuronic acid exporter